MDINLGKDLEARLKALSDKKQRSKRQLTKEALILYIDSEEAKEKESKSKKSKSKSNNEESVKKKK